MSLAERAVRPSSLPERALRRFVEMWRADPEGFDHMVEVLCVETRPVFGSVTFVLVEGAIVSSDVRATHKVAR